jgi:hypothetical protein
MGALSGLVLRIRRRSTFCAAAASIALVAVAVPPVLAASPDSDSLTARHPRVEWSGGPLTGTYNQGTCAAPSCDEFTIRSAVPASYWAKMPGGIAIKIGWADTNEELDLYVLDSTGNVVTSSQLGGVDSQQVFLADPAPGAYVVQVEAFYAVNLLYSGTAAVVREGAAQAKIATSSLRFSPPAVVDPQFTTGEPGLLVEPNGTAIVDAPWHQETMTSFIWRSRPDQGGLTFDLLDSRPLPGVSDPRRRSCTLSGGGGDTDVAVDRTGTLYLADLEAASVGVSVSSDGGRTWSCSPLSASQTQDDRPWLAAAPEADGSGPNVDAYLLYRSNFVTGAFPYSQMAGKPYIQVDVTRDGGRTWTSQGSFAGGLVMETGPMVTTADGTVHEIFSGVDGGVWLASSSDQGRTFRLKLVSPRPGSPSNSFVTAAADNAGNLYAAWVEGGSFDVLYSYSTDRGSTWSAPVRISQADSTAVMPWLAAAGPGDVAVGWYGSPGRFQPGDAAPEQPWFPMVARAMHADSRSASFQVDRMSSGPTHFGVICLSGAGCGSDRSLGDFFKIGIGPDGGVVAAFDDNGRTATAADGGPPAPYVEMVRQTGGLGMTRPAIASNLVKSNGDARVPPADPAGALVPALGFTSMPAVLGQLPDAHLRFWLGDARNLMSALTATDTAVATDAYWILTWKAAGSVEYAGMHLDRTGATDFFGGDAPVPVSVPGSIRSATGQGAFSYASYPATFKLNGTVDSSAGSVTIDLGSGDYHLTSGEMLRSLQAFSMTGTLSQVQALPLQVIDSTAPRDVEWTNSVPEPGSLPLGSVLLPLARARQASSSASAAAADGAKADSTTSAAPEDKAAPRDLRSGTKPIASDRLPATSDGTFPMAAFAVLLIVYLSILGMCARTGALRWRRAGGLA